MSDEHDRLARLEKQLTVLHEVTIRIASTLDPEDVLSGVLDSLSQLVTYETARVYLVDPELGEPPDAIREAAQLVVPLRTGGRTLGALELRLRQALPEDDIRIVELLASAAAVALQNAHLYQETQRLATTDPLTGLSNYRHFHDQLKLEVQRARRLGYPIGLVLMDLDYFKQVNDRHGHPVGDRALKLVAEQLRSRLRRTDVLGRLGGEEFGAILPGATLREVEIVAEKVRHAVEALPPLRGGMTEACTPLPLSLGGASMAADAVDAEVLVGSADRALYEAKHNGRNLVRLWREPAQLE
jgi:diguanylate cyclase (GGDEF)-like protein